MTRYLLVVAGDIEPELKGPYKTEAGRDTAALAHKRAHGDRDGLFMLDITAQGRPRVASYSGAFFGDDSPGDFIEPFPADRHGLGRRK